MYTDRCKGVHTRLCGIAYKAYKIVSFCDLRNFRSRNSECYCHTFAVCVVAHFSNVCDVHFCPDPLNLLNFPIHCLSRQIGKMPKLPVITGLFRFRRFHRLCACDSDSAFSKLYAITFVFFSLYSFLPILLTHCHRRGNIYSKYWGFGV